MKIALIHPTGNNYVRNEVQALYRKNQLSYLLTGFSSNKALGSFLKMTYLNKYIVKRKWENIPASIQILNPIPEIVAGGIKTGILPDFLFEKKLVDNDKYFQSSNYMYKAFDHWASKRIEKLEIDGVYGYEDGCYETFEVAKKLGHRTIYELPIAYHEEVEHIFQEEIQLFPEFAHLLYGCKQPEWKIDRKNGEIQLADKIIVPSQFVKSSITKFKPELENKIHIVNFGSPYIKQEPKYRINNSLNLLYVGRVEPRKGFHYVVKAFKDLKMSDAYLHVAGPLIFSKDEFNTLIQNCKKIIYHGVLYGEDLRILYKNSDALIMHSLIEGLAQVQMEAIAAGCPIINTNNGGAADIILENKIGFVTQLRNINQLKEQIMELYNDVDLNNEYKINALSAAKKMTWRNYQSKISEIVEKT